MSSQTGRLALRDVIEQGWKQLQGGLLEQLKKTIEGLLAAERDRRVAERRERGEKIYRWGYTVRKCWQTAWGAHALNLAEHYRAKLIAQHTVEGAWTDLRESASGGPRVVPLTGIRTLQ